MSHIIRGRLDGETAPADAAEKYEDVLEAYRPILDDVDFDEIPARWDGEVPAYVEFSARFDHLYFPNESRDSPLNSMKQSLSV